MRKFILLGIVALLPLIIHLKFIEFPIEVLQVFRTSQVQPDLFNWWKNAVLYSVTAILLIWRWRDLPFFKACIGIYFGLVVLSSVWSRYPEVVWFGMPNYLEGAVAIGAYCVLFLTSATVAMEAKSFDGPLIFVTCVMFVAAALQYLSPEWFKISTHFLVFGRDSEYQMSMQTWPLFGTTMNSNILGTFAALVYAFFLARGKWVTTFLSVILAVVCQSRGAWLAMVVATMYLACKYRTRRLFVPLAFFVVGIAVVYLHPTHGGFKWSIKSSGRVYVWKNTLSILSPSHLLVGSGPGAFALEFPQNDAKRKIENGWTPETIVDRPHNFYLQVLHASGLLSLISLLALFGGFLLESKEIALNAAVLSYLVNVFFTDSCTSVAPLFWIFLGTGVGRLKKLNRA